MTGTGRGKQDDKEHEQKSYLVSRENGNEIVGDLPRTPPPVIGEVETPPKTDEGS
ncbi:hypothetical protein [Sciscionella marina]|uniref:hypothetical protein n=1 Tax=Sciscionella marina TaxID=508770 RepID=UPI0003A3BF71|nr:hypothetical protein [Sciscionella marina]